MDSIAIDAELEDKSKEGLAKLANALHDGCVKEVKDYDEKLNQDPNFDGKHKLERKRSDMETREDEVGYLWTLRDMGTREDEAGYLWTLRTGIWPLSHA